MQDSGGRKHDLDSVSGREEQSTASGQQRARGKMGCSGIKEIQFKSQFHLSLAG